MKKKFTYFVAAVCAALTFSACSSDKLEAYSGQTLENPESPSNAISFGTYMGKTGTTRAGYEGDLTNTSIKETTAGFGVFGYYSGATAFGTWSSWNPTTPTASTQVPNFMYNEKVTWSTAKTAWDYSPVKYWPNGIDAANGGAYPSNTATEDNDTYKSQKLSFFAYAPYVQAYADQAYAIDNTYVGGALPSGVAAAVFTSSAAPTAVQNGIVAMSKNTEGKDMYVKYILNPSDAKHIVDLTWGLRGQATYKEADNVNNTVATLGTDYNVDLTKQTVDEKVKFLFKHALARVGGNTSSTTAGGTSQVCGLWVVVDVDKNSGTPGEGQSNQSAFFTSDFNANKTLVTIEEVKIRDNYSYHYETNTSTTEKSDFLTDGWFDIMNGKWYNTSTELTHTTAGHGVTYSISATKGETVNDNDNIYALNTQIKEGTVSNASGADWNTTNSGGAEGVNLTKKKVFADEDVPGLLLIPGESGDNTLYITVKYIVRTADSKLSTGYSEVTQEITNKVTLANSILASNKYYNLVMHLGLTSVKFEAVVADWSIGGPGYDENGGETTGGTENNTSVWLPSNVVTTTVASQSIGATASTANVNLTGLSGSTLTVVSVDGSVVANTSSVTNLGITSGNANVAIAYTANTGTTKRDANVILSDGTKNIVIPLSQAAGALNVSGTGSNNGVSSFSVKDAGNNALTITKAMISIKDEGSADVEFTTTEDSNVSSITFNTSLTDSKTYTITVNYNDATGSMNVPYTAAP